MGILLGHRYSEYISFKHCQLKGSCDNYEAAVVNVTRLGFHFMLFIAVAFALTLRSLPSYYMVSNKLLNVRIIRTTDRQWGVEDWIV
ncbi:hypothetical protein TNCT_226831, partial [Trichonephila clavata]